MINIGTVSFAFMKAPSERHPNKAARG